MAELALGTVQSLLGVIRKEAQRLAGVRGDMQFIRDEMESINGLLRHLAGKERASDHQVRAWMKQVMELAYDSGKYVERYAQLGRARPRDRGFLGRLRRVSRLPWVIVVRRRVATRIRELKVRAREVGERQQRYGVAVPLKKDDPGVAGTKKLEWLAPHAHSRDAFRRAVLSGPGSDTEELIRWLDNDFQPPPLRVVAIVGVEGATLASKVYGHYKRQSSSDALFDCKLSITIRRPPSLLQILMDMLRQIHSEGYVESTRNGEETLDEEQLKAKLQAYFRGKKVLLVLSSIEDPELWHQIRGALESFACSAGSAVLFSAKDSQSASNCSPTKTQPFSHVEFYFKKASLLVPSNYSDDSRLQGIKDVLNKCDRDDYCSKLFLQALYNNPSRTVEELKNLSESLKNLSESLECSGIEKCSIENQNQMVTFCYQGLPNQYKNCLWYSAVFTRGSYAVRRASLMRRWVAEGLITKVGQLSALDEAKHCFNALLTQKLILSREVGGAGKIKSCGLNALVIGMIKETTTVDDFLDSSQLPPDLALHFSIRNGIHIRQLDNFMEPENMMEPKSAMKSMIAHQRKSMLEFLSSLPTTSRLRLLRVLDLEGCKDFKKRHLKNICKIYQLRFLNLRGTNVAKLPKQIDQLECLETLDIRGTKVQVLSVVLPALKHMLAGNIYCPDEDTHVKSKEQFSTVCMPHGIASMEKLEILSHIKVFDSSRELANIGDKLKQLRKLGVVLSGKKADMKDLFLQIDKLHRCLRSLSIRMEPPGNWDTIDAVLLTPPKLLESLRICGVRGYLPRRIRELHQLAKITLRDTLLNEDALAILGILRGLRCLRLRYHSFAEGALTFKNGQFTNLINLIIEDDILTDITFDAGTAPKLDKMVWSFIHMESLSGVKNLPGLTRLELNRGTYSFSGWVELQRGIKENNNHVVCVLNPPEDGEGSLHHEITAPGSSS